MRNYSAIAERYAEQVVSGEIPACKWTKLACERQLKDLRGGLDGYRFDEKRAHAVCDFIELMPHIKGKWARGKEKIHLEPWQVFILTTVFGWIDETGARRFKSAYNEIPRKNAKSTITSGLGLYLAFVEGEEGAEVYSAATTRDQAKIVFRDAQAMARKSHKFLSRGGIDVQARNINQLRSSSKFEALSADGGTLDGLNIHGGLLDELHAHKTRDVYDVIETGTGSREQPLIWMITTAGSNRAGICYEQRTYVTKILLGVVKDETYFGIIYTIDDEDDWATEQAWKKANPNYGVSVIPADIARLAAKALQMPSAQNNFLTKRLNVWVNADSAWMDMRAWDRCADDTLDISEFAGRSCYVGLDLASKIDIAARVTVFKREIEGEAHYYAFGQYYLPEVAVEDGRNSQYSGWDIEGLLTTTPGEVIDFSQIEQDQINQCREYKVEELAYDPWQATQLAQRLTEQGILCVEIRPTLQNFSEPMKELEAIVRSGRFHHNGDPVLTWMVSNVTIRPNDNGDIRPRKERNENKIDGVIALLMALNRAMLTEPEPPSVYETRGIEIIG